MSFDGREPAAPKQNIFLDQTDQEDFAASASVETIEAELNDAYIGVFTDVQSVVGDLSPNDWHDLAALIGDRLEDMKFCLGALAKREHQIETTAEVIPFPTPEALTDQPAA